MRKDLIKSILQPGKAANYYRSVWMDDQCQPMEVLARRWIPEHAAHITWYNALAIHFKNVRGQNYPYFQTMRKLKMPIVVIGPEHLRKINKAGCFDYAGFVEVPAKNSYFARERIVEEALSYPSPCFYSIHTGPSSPVIAHMLWKERGQECIIADLGSILDGYCLPELGGPGGGKRTRKFWRHRVTKQIVRRNLRGHK
jgi:hypothetical protein